MESGSEVVATFFFFNSLNDDAEHETYGISLMWWLTFWGVAASQPTVPPALARALTLSALGPRHIRAAVEKWVAIPDSHPQDPG